MQRGFSFDAPEAGYRDEAPPPPPPAPQQQQRLQQRYQNPAAQAQHPTHPSRYSDSYSNNYSQPVPRDREQPSRAPPVINTTYQNPNPFPVPAHQPQDWSRDRDRDPGYNSTSTYLNITPGADNFGETAAGGIAGIAMGVADAHARESGLEAMRNAPGYGPSNEARLGYIEDHREPDNQGPQTGGYGANNDPNELHLYDFSAESRYDRPSQNPQIPPSIQPIQHPEPPYIRPGHQISQQVSQSSLTPIGQTALSAGQSTPSRSTVSRLSDSYSDNPYNRYSRSLDPNLEAFDPNSIEDDGDDGLEYGRQQQSSMLNLAHGSDRGSGAAAAPVASGGLIGTIGGLVGRNRNSGGTVYDPVSNAHTSYNGANEYDMGAVKSEWLANEKTSNKKMKWIVGLALAFIILGAIAGGVVGGILSKKHSSSSSTSSDSQGQSSSSPDTSSNGDFNKNSPQVKALMNNPNLHKVFPGIDYTPMNTQYPGCLTEPPIQNNVTLDLAILSQLSNTVRLYGTDCNQTEMLLYAIDQLGLNGTVKVWLGVWLDNNATTNQRQLDQMYSILNTYGPSSFKGVIVGNEVLFREDMTAAQLTTVIQGVRANLTALGYSDLAVSSSDLGDNWTYALAEVVDYVMANIHPFFAGVESSVAAAWTWNFWQTNDVPLVTDPSKNIISETGWPSAGGTDCGGATTCVNGSVAGITEMNTFMEDFVCQSLTNGTTYFWFEAFDEPWKIIYDTPGEDWEDKWGLLDVNRVLKPGVVIPSCGGQTAP